MHHRAAGEVERTLLENPARMAVGFLRRLRGRISIRAVPIPDHMRDRQVREGKPQDREEDHRGELEALREAAGDEGDRNRREGQLEHAVHEIGQVLSLAEGRGDRGGRVFAEHKHLVPRAPERVAAGGERNAVAVDHPQDGDDAEDGKALHRRRQRVLRASHSCVEQRQTRNGHQQHKRRRGHHPGNVALVAVEPFVTAFRHGGRCGLRCRRGVLLLVGLGRRRCRSGFRLGGWSRLVLGDGGASKSQAHRHDEPRKESFHSIPLRAPPHRSRRCGCG